MGYEVAATVGAKIARPEQPAYCFIGDGSYMMLHSELQTAIQERCQKSTSCCLTMLHSVVSTNLQMNHGMGSFGTENRRRDPETGLMTGPLVMVDFAKNAGELRL